jgi:hypothetical protein
MHKSHFKSIFLLLFAFLCNACDSKTVTEIFTKKPALSAYDYTIFKLSDSLILHRPVEYGYFWNKPEQYPPLPKDLSIFPTVNGTAFQFHMPNFTGHTVENINKDFDEDKVEIVSLEYVGMGAEQPDAPGFYPPNVIKRIAASTFTKINLNNYEIKHGLRCYAKEDKDLQQECYGVRDVKLNEYILLETTPEPYPSWVRFPTMRARYYTPQYGGLVIIWSAHMKHFARWQDIDSQIWKFIAAWNVAPKQPNK